MADRKEYTFIMTVQRISENDEEYVDGTYGRTWPTKEELSYYLAAQLGDEGKPWHFYAVEGISCETGSRL